MTDAWSVDKAMELAGDYGHAAFMCGEYDGESSPEYTDLSTKRGEAFAALRAYLSLRVPAGDANGVLAELVKLKTDGGRCWPRSSWLREWEAAWERARLLALRPAPDRPAPAGDVAEPVAWHGAMAEIQRLDRAATPPDREALLLAKDALESAEGYIKSSLGNASSQSCKSRDERKAFDRARKDIARTRIALAAINAALEKT